MSVLFARNIYIIRKFCSCRNIKKFYNHKIAKETNQQLVFFLMWSRLYEFFIYTSHFFHTLQLSTDFILMTHKVGALWRKKICYRNTFHVSCTEKRGWLLNGRGSLSVFYMKKCHNQFQRTVKTQGQIALFIQFSDASKI